MRGLAILCFFVAAIQCFHAFQTENWPLLAANFNAACLSVAVFIAELRIRLRDKWLIQKGIVR